jgi:chemotaxis-related protein WspD
MLNDTSPNEASGLLDREIPPEYRREWTDHIAEEVTPLVRGTHAVVVFRIGVEWLALPAAIFVGVTERTALHSLPHQREGIILGVTNVRGDLVICISLGTLLGGLPAATSTDRWLVVQAQGGPLVFPVDYVHGILRYHPSEVSDVPATLANARERYTSGLLAWEDRSIALLDDARIFAAIHRALG